MADVSKFKKTTSRRLGPPPSIEDASKNLSAPEIAPSPVIADKSFQPDAAIRRRDGRSMRRTGRTVNFATRVSQEFDERLRNIAEQQGLMLVEVMEQALTAYEKELASI
ncbi:MAG: hypothetical protein EOP14_02890 [Pseudomonas sp.]|nr:MAG: hypothetical protein EOP14_02890 [Pseudomonas sp.]